MRAAQNHRLRGIVGPVGSILKVKPGYETAIETALGFAAQNIVVLKTIEGMAQGAAFALDNMGDTDIVGTLAGDDTIFLVFHDNIQALDFCEQVKQMLR